jgi:hypothetical protein
MPAQTVQPDQWIIVDDGQKPYGTKGLPEYAEHIRRDPSNDPPGHTIGLNMAVALNHVRHEHVIMMEDDDWYSPYYLAYMTGLLIGHPLVGLWGTNYYHVKSRGWREMGRNGHAALAVTGFHNEMIPALRMVIPGDIQFDLRIWRAYGNMGRLVAGRTLGMHCSMKGLPGRAGAGVGHKKRTGYYMPDLTYTKLRQWCKDADIYIAMMEGGHV